MKLRPAAVMIALLLAGSAASAQVPETAPTVRSIPDLGVETEAEVGQAMVLRESLVTATSLRVLNEVRSESMGGLGRLVLYPGVYRLDHVNDKGRFYRAERGVGLRQLGLTDRVEGGILIPPEPQGVPTAYQVALLGTGYAKAPDVKLEAVDQSGFRRELIYSGVAQRVVNLTYREFTNDFARPAFTQELKYDLNEGTEIGFRGARLEILKATNTSVTFKLIKALDAPQP